MLTPLTPGFLQGGLQRVRWHGLQCKGLSRKQTLLCIKGQHWWRASPPVGVRGTGVSVLLIWCSLGKASIMGDVLRIKLPCCKAAACTRSGCRFMLPPKQNEQHRRHLGFGGNEPFHHIDFLKHLKKKLCQLLAFGPDCDESAHISGLSPGLEWSGMVSPAICCLSNR